MESDRKDRGRDSGGHSRFSRILDASTSFKAAGEEGTQPVPRPRAKPKPVSRPRAKQKPKRQVCRCPCPCKRRPNRLIQCRNCDAWIGPGCCAVRHLVGALDGLCHLCDAGETLAAKAKSQPREQVLGRAQVADVIDQQARTRSSTSRSRLRSRSRLSLTTMALSPVATPAKSITAPC